MGDYLDEKALTRLSGRKYAQSEASEKISEVSSAPRASRRGRGCGWYRERSYESS
jgi:hypothetical protein